MKEPLVSCIVAAMHSMRYYWESVVNFTLPTDAYPALLAELVHGDSSSGSEMRACKSPLLIIIRTVELEVNLWSQCNLSRKHGGESN